MNVFISNNAALLKDHLKFQVRSIILTMTAMSALVMSLLSVLLLVVTNPNSLTSAGPSGTKCPPAQGRPETCVCQPTNQNLVDMTPLSNTNGTARHYNYILFCWQ